MAGRNSETSFRDESLRAIGGRFPAINEGADRLPARHRCGTTSP